MNENFLFVFLLIVVVFVGVFVIGYEKPVSGFSLQQETLCPFSALSEVKKDCYRAELFAGFWDGEF